MLPVKDPTTETLVLAFIELIHTRKVRGKAVLAATQQTIASLLTEATGLNITPRHVQILTSAMEEANLITIGGGGIGYPNTYDTREDDMGPEIFWNQVDAFLAVYAHPSRSAMVGSKVNGQEALGGDDAQ
ncbi:MAG TPA: hypothetical protein GXX57_01145 [Firmicutes bacterium]|jgi:hypothetical protein|nr:hypothetical protein [Bacillota bacterium]